jgi:ParB-like chromosome segregation protein Spo0J
LPARKHGEPESGKRRAWPAEKVQMWSLDRIKPYPKNPRTHSDDQIRQIADSMRRFGVTSPVLVDEGGVIIYGHGRRRAAELLGLRHLPVVIARGWSEDDKRAYRIADNQLALNAGWDVPLLSAELIELSMGGYDMPVLGFPEMKLVQYLSGNFAPEGDVAAQLEGLKFAVIIECENEKDQSVRLSQFHDMGLKCRALIS